MSLDLNHNVQYVKGVGPSLSVKLNRLGIFTALDLLYHFPREYEDRRVLRQLRKVKEGEKIILEGIRQVKDGDKIKYDFRDPQEVLSNLKYHAE